MSQPQNIFSLGEYNSLILNKADNQAYSMTTGKLSKLSGQPAKVVAMAGGLHTQYLIDDAANAWAYDDASKTTGAKPIATNVLSVVGDANSTTPAIIYKDGTLSVKGVKISFPSGAGAIIDVCVCANGIILALDSLGNVYSWGFSGWGANWALMQGTANPNSNTPTKVALPAPVKMMCAHNWAAHFLLQDGRLFAGGLDYRYYGYALNGTTQPNAPIQVDQLYKLPAPITQIACNYMTTFAILADKSMWGWGENTSGTVGNGQETDPKTMNPTYYAPWYNSPQWNAPSSQGGALFVQLPVQIGKGIQWAFANRGCYNMYQEAEDISGNIYTWGRNKSCVLMNGIIGTSDQQANQPNLWDVLVPTLVQPFGAVVVPPINQAPLAAIARIQPLTLPANVITLDGSTSIDPDGKIVSYAWMQVSGPLAVIMAAGANITQAILTAAGTYVFQLTVTDNSGASNSVTASVLVNPVPICPPVPTPRTVTDLKLNQFGSWQDVPTQYAKFTFSDGSTQ